VEVSQGGELVWRDAGMEDSATKCLVQTIPSPA